MKKTLALAVLFGMASWIAPKPACAGDASSGAHSCCMKSASGDKAQSGKEVQAGAKTKAADVQAGQCPMKAAAKSSKDAAHCDMDASAAKPAEKTSAEAASCCPVKPSADKAVVPAVPAVPEKSNGEPQAFVPAGDVPSSAPRLCVSRAVRAPPGALSDAFSLAQQGPRAPPSLS